MLRILAAAIALAFVLPACGLRTESSSSPSPSPASSPVATQAAPEAPRGTRSVPVKAPTTPAPAPSMSAPLPGVTPPPTPRVAVPMLRPDAPPQILAVRISKTVVGSGDTVSGRVVTSSNVASVEARVASYGVSLDKVGVGRFALIYEVGTLPFFVRGTYELRIIARNTRGASVEERLPITVR